MVDSLKAEIQKLSEKSIFSPNVDCLTEPEWETVIAVFKSDYARYYTGDLDFSKVKYFPGLLATLCYRISRSLFLKGDEKNALEYSSLGFSLTAIEMYYSADIGQSLKINHGAGTVIGSRTKVGNNVLLHQNVTLGEKNGGRASIGNNVTVYPGAIIVGDVFIGDNSIVGANVFTDKSHPENSKII
ncbi:serine O-acetyltransferase [Flavobacterium pedocola]